MTNPRRTMDQPPHVGLPLTPPEPVAGCGVCEALAKQRATAQASGDMTRVTDCNVEIRQHPHPVKS